MIREQLNGIATFVQAVESGSFALAAHRMRVTRSAVGKSIARLEHSLGVRLFHRTTRRLNLTEDGQVFYERCVRALAEIDAAEAALDNGRRAPVGRLRVSVPVLFGRHCVAPVLSKLAHQYGGLKVEISFSDRIVDLVEEGFDLAVRIGTLTDSASLAARRLGTERMGIYAAPSYLAPNMDTPTVWSSCRGILRSTITIRSGRTATTSSSLMCILAWRRSLRLWLVTLPTSTRRTLLARQPTRGTRNGLQGCISIRTQMTVCMSTKLQRLRSGTRTREDSSTAGGRRIRRRPNQFTTIFSSWIESCPAYNAAST
jgi:DNA-binding transcriptional LysR family regulator